MDNPEAITLKAPAKINLNLAVERRRSDGYHDLNSLMVKVDLFDLLRLKKGSSGVNLRCSHDSLPDDSGNIVHRAATAFLNEIDSRHGVEIELEKHIPVAAGLGGGSSDAASTLRGMNVLFGKPLEEQSLGLLARSLGADVPFLLSQYSAAWATGIGDLLEEDAVAEGLWIVLVNSGVAVSTRWVYENLALTTQSNAYILGRKQKNGLLLQTVLKRRDVCLFNDLEAVTIKRYPFIDGIKKELLALGAEGVLMAGSGPTVFGIFQEREIAESCWHKIRSRYSNVFLVQPLQVGS